MILMRYAHTIRKLKGAVAFVGGLTLALALIILITPSTVYGNNSAGHNYHWNWLHNRAYHPPQFHFQTAFAYDQWGRPTTSNATPEHTRNIRRDRHSAALPPSHGVLTGFYSGEFPTEQANPFAPSYNNNPNASFALFNEASAFALLPGEAGVNVLAEGSHIGGFLANTSVIQGGGNIASNNTSHGGQSDFMVNHRPIESAQAHSLQSFGQRQRITTVTPFEDGTIARITIPALDNRVALVRSGVDIPTLDNYVGHFPQTSQWDGNIALASHNRGRGSFFAGIWTLHGGDRIIYETTMGVRVFEVVSIDQISERDLSSLDYSRENTLVLITCVYNRPELRWSIRAMEVA
jgi:sortase A